MRKNPKNHRPKKQRQTHIANQKERDLWDEPQENPRDLYHEKKAKKAKLHKVKLQNNKAKTHSPKKSEIQAQRWCEKLPRMIYITKEKGQQSENSWGGIPKNTVKTNSPKRSNIQAQQWSEKLPRMIQEQTPEKGQRNQKGVKNRCEMWDVR